MRGLPPPCERAEMDGPLRVWGFLLPTDPAVALIGENPTDAGLPAARCQRRSRQGGTPCGCGISGLHPSSTLDSHSNKMGKPRRAWLPAIAAFPPCGAAGRPAGKRAGTPILKALWREAPAASTPNIRPPSPPQQVGGPLQSRCQSQPWQRPSSPAPLKARAYGPSAPAGQAGAARNADAPRLRRFRHRFEGKTPSHQQKAKGKR